MNESRLLTDQERKRFAEWLLQDAMSNRLLAEQLSKMHLPLADMKTRLADAAELIAKELLATESWSLR